METTNLRSVTSQRLGYTSHERKGTHFLTRTIRVFAFLSLLGYATLAAAQSGSVYWAAGTATDSSSGPINTLDGGVVYDTPRMGGFFDTVGGDIILRHGLGVGADISFRQNKGPYAGLAYRPTFYDVNAVYHPRTINGRLIPEVQAGFGRLNLKFYDTPQFCLTYSQGCQSTTGEITTRNRFSLNGGGGLNVYVYKSFFIRPQVDIRWVHHLVDFGSSWVPEYTVALGYTFRKGR